MLIFIFSAVEAEEIGKRVVIFKLKTFYFEPIKKALEAAGFTVQYAKIEK